MFSSNQVLQISGELDAASVERALKFCLDVAGVYHQTLVWQALDSGEFCIGVQYAGDLSVPEGWNCFPVSDDFDIAALTITKFLERQKFPKDCGGDGSNDKGFLVEQITYKDDSHIKGWRHGVIKFSPFTNFYHK